MKTRISGLTKKMDDRHTDRHKARQMDGMTKSWAERYMNRQTDEQRKRIGRHVIGQMYIYIYTSGGGS